MAKNLQTKFSTRQYMLSRDFEIYYYNEPASEKVSIHSHDYYEFYFFLEGDVSIWIEGEQYPLKYGDMVLIPPGIKHMAMVHGNEIPYRRFVFWISVEYCNQLMEVSSSYGYLMQNVLVKKIYIFHNDLITFNTIQYRIFQLIEEIKSERFGKEAKVSLCVNDLVLQLNRIVYEQQNPKSEKEEQNLYQNIIYYIDDHLDEELSLEQLAGQFFVSKYHIAHIFKEQMGLSVHQYILKKRMQASKAAILGETSITDVYTMFGFKDYSSFYRAFKKEFGVSPVMDALLGAAALGDIGKHFPDTDPQYKGISSIRLLEHVAKLIEEKGYIVENIDATIIAQKPKMRPYIEEMEKNIAAALHIDVSQVNVKATTEEGLGFTGTEQGISSQAICALTTIYESSVAVADSQAGCAGCAGCRKQS